MNTINVKLRSGQTKAVNASPGFSIMEAIRDAGIDELQALCGGCLSCATCHVYVDPARLADLPQMSSDEADLLGSTEYRESNSRLSCQLEFHSALDGLNVTIAPEV